MGRMGQDNGYPGQAFTLYNPPSRIHGDEIWVRVEHINQLQVQIVASPSYSRMAWQFMAVLLVQRPYLLNTTL